MMPPIERIHAKFRAGGNDWILFFTDRRMILAYISMSGAGSAGAHAAGTVARGLSHVPIGGIISYTIEKSAQAQHEAELERLSPDQILALRKESWMISYSNVNQVVFKKGVFGLRMTVYAPNECVIDLNKGDFENIWRICNYLFPGRVYPPGTTTSPQPYPSMPSQPAPQGYPPLPTPTEQVSTNSQFHYLSTNVSTTQQYYLPQTSQRSQMVSVRCWQCGYNNMIDYGQNAFRCMNCGAENVKR